MVRVLSSIIIRSLQFCRSRWQNSFQDFHIHMLVLEDQFCGLVLNISLSPSLIETFYSKSQFNVGAHYTVHLAVFSLSDLSSYAVKMLKSGPVGGRAGGRNWENEQPKASPTRQLKHGDSSPSVIRPETQTVRQSEWPPVRPCSTPSSPPPWGGTSTTTRRCTTCRCSHTSSQTSSQISTVGWEGTPKTKNIKSWLLYF